METNTTTEIGQFHYQLVNAIKLYRPEMLLEENKATLNAFVHARVDKATAHFEELRRDGIDVQAAHESTLEVLYGDLIQNSPCQVIKDLIEEHFKDYFDELVEKNRLEHFAVKCWQAIKNEYSSDPNGKLGDEYIHFRMSEFRMSEEIEKFIPTYGI